MEALRLLIGELRKWCGSGDAAIGVLGLLVVLGAGCSKPETGAAAPTNAPANVVLIVVDTLRADCVGAERNGEPLMPKLAKLAAESVRFSNASSPCSWTRPAMASVFTSTHVDTHQVYYMGDPRSGTAVESDALPDALETMAAYLKKAGYATRGIHNNANVASSLGFSRGFNLYEYLSNKPDDAITDHAIEVAGALPEPFFLYVHYMAPHAPYEAPPEYRKRFGWPSDPAAAAAAFGMDSAALHLVQGFTRYCVQWQNYKRGLFPHEPPRFAPAAQNAVKALYDAEVRFADDQVARLAAFLCDRYPHTYYIILADHGEHFWEHDYLGHGLTLYEEEARVPFMIAGPGLAPAVVPRPAGTVDILPTVAGLLALEPNPAWQGAPLFEDHTPVPADRPVFSRTKGRWSGHNIDLDMVKRGSLKLIRDRKQGTVELYNLEDDPQEKNNLADQHPAHIKELTALLDAQREQNRRARPKNAGKKRPLNAEAREQLKALGYAGGG